MKKLMIRAVSLWVVIIATASCARKPNTVSAEANLQALSRSLFDQGASVPDNGNLVLLNGGASFSEGMDGGFIAPPSQTGSGDTGAIAGPGEGSTSSDSGGSAPVTEVLPPASETGSGNSGETSSSGTTSGSNTSTNSGTSGTETSGSGGNDGGIVAPPAGDQTADNGGIPSGTISGGDGGQTGTGNSSGASETSIDDVAPGVVVINESGDPIPQTGTESGDSTSANNSGSASGNGDTSTNDSGSFNPGSTPATVDGGNTGTGSSNVADNGGTFPGTSQGGESGTSGSGSSTGGNTDVADNTSSSNSGSNSSGGGTDSGSTSNGNQTGSTQDGGSLTGGGTSTSDNGGTSASGGSISDGGGTPVAGGGTKPPVSSCPGANQPNPKPCGCVPQNPNNQFSFQLRRVCSINRSKGEGLFFEEAKNPIITIEHVTKSGNSSAYYASFGYGKYPTEPKSVKGLTGRSLAYLSLKGVDLFKGPYKSKTTLMLENFKKSAGFWWWSKYVNVRVCEDSNQDGFCFDEPTKNQLAFEVPQFKSGQLPRSLQIEVWSGRHLTKSKNPSYCESQYSPLVLDLKGNGLDLMGPEAGVQFDLNDTGYPIRTGWIGAPDDALLVRDLNGSRRIESGAELFGSATKLPSGAKAINGFEALRPLDSDSDGLITDKDRAWAELKLWIDDNKDGISQRRELMTLDRAGIESIDLRYVEILEVDSHGNQTRERSNFVRKLLGKRYVLTVSDVWFNSFSQD